MQKLKYEEVTDSMVQVIQNMDKNNMLLDRELYKNICTLNNEAEKARLENILFDRAKELNISSEVKKLYRAFKKQAKTEKLYDSEVSWIDEKGQINEKEFCIQYIEATKLKCINKQFYGENGFISDEEIKNDINKIITKYAENRISNKVTCLIEALKIFAYSPQIKPDTDFIHLKNGTLNILDNSFDFLGNNFCLNRLNVKWKEDDEVPAVWMNFLFELLAPEDIYLLQEFLGYCLIPTNKAQTMLIITGNGGEGKSRIGLVVKELFGKNAIFGNIQDFETKNFSVASLENKLVFIDDDIDTSALKKTSTIKNIVTAEAPILVERKGIQAYEANIYAKLLLFGNGILNALYDHTDGFFRRQLIIEVLPKKEERIDDKNLIDKLKAEKELIFKWCFEGLKRLIKNDYNFTINEKIKATQENMKKSSFNFIDFLENSNYIKFTKSGKITSADLCLTYAIWCTDNKEERFKDATILQYLRQNQKKYNVKPSNHIKNERDRIVRGFKGIRRTILFYNEIKGKDTE